MQETLKNVKAEKLAQEGLCITRPGGKTTFVRYAVPGDVLDIFVFKEKKSFSEAKIVNVRKKSPQRTNPPCEHFGKCGGCAHQNIEYESQIEYKKALLNETFRKIAREDEIKNVMPSPKIFNYRNKLQLQCEAEGKKLVAGFYKAKSHEIVKINRCPLHSDEMNDLAEKTVTLLNELKISPYKRKIKKGVVKDIVIRQSEKNSNLTLTLVINTKDLPEKNKLSKILFKNFKNLKGFYTFYNPYNTEIVFKNAKDINKKSKNSPLQKIFGETIKDEILGTSFNTSPLSFFQINTKQTENIVKEIISNIEEEKKKSVLIDVYSGLGTFSLTLSKYFSKVYAIEIVKDAVTLLKENCKWNKIKNVYAIEGDAGFEMIKLLEKEALYNFKKVLFLDPPRAGLSEEMRNVIKSSDFEKIIYLSCNPQTQARDYEDINANGKYKVDLVSPFDMFPHTHHLENLLVLKKR